MKRQKFTLVPSDGGVSEEVEATRQGKRFMARCPWHADSQPSLSIDPEKEVFYCFSCRKRGLVCNGNRCRPKKPDHIYTYRDKGGNPLFQVLRLGNGREKKFKVRRPDGTGGWIWGLGDVKPCLYRLDEVIKADKVVIVEGEKDADAISKWGFTATTNPFGAGKWRSEYAEALRGKDVWIIPDLDEPGREHAEKVAQYIHRIAGSVRIAKLPDHLPPGGDICDHIEQLKDKGMESAEIRQELLKVLDEATAWEPQLPDRRRGNSFCLIKASELLKQPAEETRWVWDGILPQGGMSLLVAKPKVGKSTLALNLAVAVSRGEDFLGRATVPAPVIYLALEEKTGELRERLEALGVGDDELLYLHLGLAPRGALGEIDNLITTSGAGLLIVDTLQKLARVRDLNDYAQVTITFEPLLGVARERNCHILLTHHAGKTDRTDGDEILGSTGLLGAVDTAIILKKREQGRTFHTVQRYGENIPETVLVLNDNYSLTTDGTLEDVNKGQIWDQIKSILEVNPGLTESEIVEETSCRKMDTAAALRWAFNERLVHREGAGKKGDPYKYFLPPLPPIYIREGEKQEEKSPLTNQKHWDISPSRGSAPEPHVGREKSEGEGELKGAEQETTYPLFEIKEEDLDDIPF